MKKQNFTLVEILVVMVIITILTAFAMGAYATVKKKAYRAQTISAMKSLETAIRSYESTYNQLPFTIVTADVDVQVNDTNDVAGDGYQLLITTLAGTDAAKNPRKIPFLTLDADGSFTDAWGEALFVSFDLSYDGAVDEDKIFGYGLLSRTIAIWSKGPDMGHDVDDANVLNDYNVNSWEK
ncbi:MAG: type II secretion system protein [Lentisphaeria bacterium]|nr:type II secretion system protein [Lentisphaeria bacterium]